jgi:hypothetical protein
MLVRFHQYSNVEDTEAIPFNVFGASYMTVLDELGAPREHRAPLIHHDLKGRALDFVHEKIQVNIIQLAEVLQKFLQKFAKELMARRKQTLPEFLI